MLEEMHITSFDDTSLFVRKTTVDNAKGLIVVVHGLSESCDRYRELVQVLNSYHYDVVSFDNRGNGRSGGATGDCQSFHDFLDDLHFIVNNFRNGYQKVYILGHSLGGFIVNAYVSKYQDIDGVISSGAVGLYLNQVKAFRFIPFKPLKKLWIKNNLSNVLSHDPMVAENYIKDPYVNKYNRLNLFGECFIKGIKYLHKNYHHYEGAILYLHGGDDRIVPAKSSQLLYEKSNSKDKKLIIYPDLYHEIFNEIERQQVYDDLKEWLEAHE